MQTRLYLKQLKTGLQELQLIEWRTRRTLLKAVFPLSASNYTAKYDSGVGYTERENNNEKLYEVPAQKWADITDTSGEFGVSILTDCKHGWDKPDNNTLRLTCIHSPLGAFTASALVFMAIRVILKTELTKNQ